MAAISTATCRTGPPSRTAPSASFEALILGHTLKPRFDRCNSVELGGVEAPQRVLQILVQLQASLLGVTPYFTSLNRNICREVTAVCI
jgi:hypothetical protein